MNYTLQVHGERSLYQVPPGLYELLSDVSREVLRDQPDQVYRYIANYMDTLLKLRTNMKKALEVVDDVIADNKELFSYVDALGLSWEEANKYARIMQRTFRRFKARKELKEKVIAEREGRLRKAPFVEHSPSFIDYFESLGVDYDTANKASLTIQNAFKTHVARKQMKTMERCSTHTIDMIAPAVDVSLVMEKPTSRNSKLFVYQESPAPSVNSGWYKPLPDESTKTVREKRSVASSTSHGLIKTTTPFKRYSKLLVYEQSPSPSIDTIWYAAQRKDTDVSLEARRLGLTKGMSFLERDEEVPTKPSRAASTPKVETSLPTYFDADLSKVPMISETGQLDVLEEDVVTLFSTDTFKLSKSFVDSATSDQSQRIEKVPSMKDLGKKPSKTDSETAKELFSIIEKKPSENEKLNEVSGSRLLESETDKTPLLIRLSALSRSHTKSDEDRGLSIRPSQTATTASLRPKTSSRISKSRAKLSDEFESIPEQ